MKKVNREGRMSSLKINKRGINMKKTLIVFLTAVLAMSMLYVSCSNETKIDSSPVEVSFGASQSRSLSANVSFEDFDNLNWYYKANLYSGEFSQGATGEDFVLLQDGLATQITFSQGIWDFELKAKKVQGEEEVEIYRGNRTGVLIQRQPNSSILTIQIDVMPSSEINGTIVIDPNVNVGGKKVNKVKIGSGEATELNPSGNNSFSMEPNTYEVTLTYEKTVSSSTGGETKIEYGSETITVTVYGGAVTTISGDISEITQTVVIEPVGKFSTTSTVAISGKQGVTLESSLTPAMDADANSVAKTTVILPDTIKELNFSGEKNVVLTTTVYPVEEAITNENFTVTGSNNTTVAAIDLKLKVGTDTVSTFKKSNEESVAVTVKTYILKGLNPNNISVKYNGTDGGHPTDVQYNPVTGELSFKTTHFSEFYVVSGAVCYNTDKYVGYSDLNDAIGAASDGDTIVLLDNTSMTLNGGDSCISIVNKGITIDGSGKAINLSAENAVEKYGIYIDGIDSSKTVTIKNTTINTTNLERAIRTYGNIGFKIENSTITTNGVGVHVKGANKADICNTQITVNVIGDNVYSAHRRAGVVVGGSDAKVTVDGCTINATNKNKTEYTENNPEWNWNWCKGLYVGYGALNAVLTVNNTNVVADYSIAIDGSGTKGSPTKIIVNSGKFDGIIGSPSGNSYKEVTINGGTFTGIENYNGFYGKDNSIAKLVISGGKFNVEPNSDYIVDCYCAVAQGDKWIVQEAPVVIGTKGYATLDDAIKDAKSGDTITLRKDSVGKGIGSADGNQTRGSLTIDFNGYTYTMNDPAVGSTGTKSQAMHWGTSLGAVTLKNGTFKVAQGTTSVKMALQNYIDFTAENMTFDFSNIPVTNYGTTGKFDPNTGIFKEYSGLEVPMFNNNSGKMVLKNSTITMPNDSTKGISADGDGVDIFSCTIDGAINLQDQNSVVRIKNSTVSKEIVSYFNNDTYKIISTTDDEGYDVYRLVETPTEEQYSFIE